MQRRRDKATGRRRNFDPQAARCRYPAREVMSVRDDFLVEMRGFERRCSWAMRLGDRERSGTGWMRAGA